MGLVLGIIILVLFIIISTIILWIKDLKHIGESGNVTAIVIGSIFMIAAIGGTIFIAIYCITY